MATFAAGSLVGAGATVAAVSGTATVSSAIPAIVASTNSVFYSGAGAVTAAAAYVANNGGAMLQLEDPVVHLLSSVTQSGHLNPDLNGELLMSLCESSNVKLLTIGSSNPAEVHISHFNASRKHLNLVMTLDRKGRYRAWLSRLLGLLRSGQSVPAAWVELAPQGKPFLHVDLPDCILVAGRPGVILLP